jgi:hypothetical protein
MESVECSTNECIFPGDPEALLSWVNSPCNLTAKAQSRWNESTTQREDVYSHLISTDTFHRHPPCATECPGLAGLYQSSLVGEPCNYFGCVNPPPSTLLNNTILCAGLADPSICTNSCTFAYDPRKLLVWVNSTCPLGSYDFTQWSNATMAKENEWLSLWIPQLLPWNWSVQAFPAKEAPSALGIQITDPAISSSPFISVPPSGPGTCMVSTSEKLGVFAAVNIAMAFLLPIIGRHTVVNKLTFGVFGILGSKWWPAVGIISACLNVLANAVNVHLIRATPGYEDVPFGSLVLLWCTRPRLSWLVVFLAAYQAEDGMYFGAAASAITSEAILQSLGAVYFGIIAHYGKKKQFYILNHLNPYPRGLTAHMMYAGALLWLIMFAGTLIGCSVALVGLNKVITNARKMMRGIENAGNAIGSPFRGKAWIPKWIRKFISRKQQGPTVAPWKLTEAEIRDIWTVISATIIFVAFLAQWLFWAGFVGTAGERYIFTFFFRL